MADAGCGELMQAGLIDRLSAAPDQEDASGNDQPENTEPDEGRLPRAGSVKHAFGEDRVQCCTDREHAHEASEQKTAALAVNSADESEIGRDEHGLSDAEQNSHEIQSRQICRGGGQNAEQREDHDAEDERARAAPAVRDMTEEHL